MKGRARKSDPRVMTQVAIDEFLDYLDDKGSPMDSLDTYRRKLTALYDFLGAEKRLSRDTLPKWRVSLLQQGYAEPTANAFIYVANSYLN